jgi:hypothetical protein
MGRLCPFLDETFGLVGGNKAVWVFLFSAFGVSYGNDVVYLCQPASLISIVFFPKTSALAPYLLAQDLSPRLHRRPDRLPPPPMVVAAPVVPRRPHPPQTAAHRQSTVAPPSL